MPTPGFRPTPGRWQRVVVHAVVDGPGGTLVVPGPGGAGSPWVLPGAVVEHGERPRDRLRAAVENLTGDAVEIRDVIGLTDDVLQTGGLSRHTVRVVFAARAAAPTSPELRFERGDDAGAVRGVPDAWLDDPAPAAGPVDPVGGPRAPKVQRLAAYAIVIVDGRVLMTRLRGIAGGMSGRWTLPGGGVDHAEHPERAVVREVYEEAGLGLAVGGVIDVDSRHFTGRAPDGRLEDFHSVRVIYRGSVPAASTPRVIEVNGSTDRAEWVPLTRVHRLPLTDLARRWLPAADPDRADAAG